MMTGRWLIWKEKWLRIKSIERQTNGAECKNPLITIISAFIGKYLLVTPLIPSTILNKNPQKTKVMGTSTHTPIS